MIALIRDLLSLDKVEVIVRTFKGFDLMRNALPNIHIEKIQTDVGPQIDTRTVDSNITFTNFARWIESETQWLSRESEFVRHHPADLIVTDISPIALKLAEKIRCPCVTVANFSWIDVLKPLPDHKEKGPVLDWLANCFAIPEQVIKLPFSMNMEGFRTSKIEHASLLCRKPTSTIDKVRKELGISADKALVVVSFGGHIPPRQDLKIKNNGSELLLLSPSPIMINGIKVMAEHSESQNIIMAADFVIAKAGYSTLAECAKFRRPLSIIPRAGYPEDQVLVKEAIALGLESRTIFQDSNYCIEVPDKDEVAERRIAIKEDCINELERLPSSYELIKRTLR